MKKSLNIMVCLLLFSITLLIFFTSCEQHEHIFGEWQTALEPTCVAEGILERSCECGAKDTNPIPMIEHEKGEWVITVAPTCTEEGEQKRTCICGSEETETLSALGHNVSEWVTDAEANIFGKGQKHNHCMRCNITLQTEEIPQVVSQGLEYRVNPDGSTCTITGTGSCDSSYIGIPAEIDGYKVTAIGNGAFHQLFAGAHIKEVYIPEGVTEIDVNVFEHCNYLERINIPNSLERIFSDFNDCDKIQCNEYNGGYYLGNQQNPYHLLIGVKNSDIVSFEVHSKTRIIADHAFAELEKLANVSLPNGLISIESAAFIGCGALKYIELPDSLNYIGRGAFADSALVHIELPDGIEEIDEMFSLCENLESVVLGKGLKFIGDQSFYSCSNLKSVVIEEGVKHIGDFAFADCVNLESIIVPNSLESIGIYAFRKCNKLKYNEYQNAYYIGNEQNPYVVLMEATNTNIKTCNIHKNTKIIFEGAFKNCSKLSSISLPDGLLEIYESAFQNCSSLKKVVIPESVVNFGDYVFSGCKSLNEAIFVGILADAGNYTFMNCENLTNVVLPKGLTSLGDAFFSGCKKLKTVDIPETVVLLADGVFQYCENLKGVTLPNEIKWIDSWLFEGCKSLTEIKIPNGVEYIGVSAFHNCVNLKEIILPEGVTEIYSYAFKGCVNLERIVIPNSIKSIGSVGGEGAFEGCSKLNFYEYGNAYYLGNPENPYLILVKAKDQNITSCDVHVNTKEICDYAFYGCKNLRSILIPDGITTINRSTFEGCTSLEIVVLPESVSRIKNDAFKGCSSLRTINFSLNISFIGGNAFDKCSSLSEIYFSGSKASWESIRKYKFRDEALPNYVVHCTDGDVTVTK